MAGVFDAEPWRTKACTGVDLLHVAYCGLSGHYPVVRNLVRLAERDSLSSAVVAVGSPEAHDAMKDEWNALGVPVYCQVLRHRGDVSSLRSLYELGRRLRFSLVLGHSHRMTIPILVGRRTQSRRAGPLTAISVSHGPPEASSPLGRLNQRMLEVLSDGIVSVEARSASQLSSTETRPNAWRWGKPIFRIPNGVEVLRAQVRHLSVDGREPMKIVMAGRMVSGKRFDDLIEAMALLNDQDAGNHYTLTLLGDGPRRGQLETMSSRLRLKDKVSFLGHISHTGVLKIVANSDVYVQASDREGVSMAILEAMSCGLPVVATASPGLTQLIDPDRNGLTYTAGSAHELAEALRSLKDPQTRRSLGEGGLKTVAEHYSDSRMWAEYRGVFEYLGWSPQ